MAWRDDTIRQTQSCGPCLPSAVGHENVAAGHAARLLAPPAHEGKRALLARRAREPSTEIAQCLEVAPQLPVGRDAAANLV